MTLAEFKAWLEGFEEAMDAAPTPEQWAKIKDRIGQIAAPIPVSLKDLDWSKEGPNLPHRSEPLRVFGPTWIENPPSPYPYTTCSSAAMEADSVLNSQIPRN